MTSLMTSPSHKIGQILKFICYVSRTHDVIDDVTRSQRRSNFESDISPSIFELQRRSKLKMSEMLMAIFLVYSPSGITSGKKVCRKLKKAAIF